MTDRMYALLDSHYTRLLSGAKMVTTPTITINGTRPHQLLEQQELAINGLRMAISTLALSAPNARDYQTAPPDAFSKAMNEHRWRLAQLEAVMGELEQLAEYLSAHID